MDATIEFFEKESGEVRTNHEYFVLNGEVWRDNYDTCESQEAVVGFDRFVVKVPEIGWRIPALASKESEMARLRDAIEEFDTQLTNWAKAYPLSVFPEPDLTMAHKLLQTAGMTLDAVSASNMRHVTSKLNELFEPVRAITQPPKDSK